MKNRIGLFAVALLFASALKAQQPPLPDRRPSPEERLKRTSEHLGKELTLKPAQKQKLEAAYKDFFASMEKLRGDGPPPPPPPPPGKKEEVDKLVAARDSKVKSILTATQFKKYQQIKKDMRMHRPGGLADGRGGPQGPPPQGPPPQGPPVKQ
ncbi:hypothetical protein [Mucilaginibacter sp. HD30]